MGKPRVIAETGAGQHGVATATACALLGLECVVYMGTTDIERQAPNVQRMGMLGAEVRPVATGNGTLRDALNEALRDWVANVEDTFYVLGSAAGPHPYPEMVASLQEVIGREARAQMMRAIGRVPDAVVACVGGGSNAIGIMRPFIDTAARLIGVEAGGRGDALGDNAASLGLGAPGVLHGAFTMLTQDAAGQVVEPHSVSAGLDYPGVGPQLAALAEAGRLEVRRATDAGALEATQWLARSCGIIPALESAHAMAAVLAMLPDLPADSHLLVNLSGRGDKDLGILERELAAGERPVNGPQRVRRAFDAAAADERTALIAYVLAGFPTEADGVAAAEAALAGGADILEVGVPFSDPLADGPTIADAGRVALAARRGTPIGGAAGRRAAQARARSTDSRDELPEPAPGGGGARDAAGAPRGRRRRADRAGPAGACLSSAGATGRVARARDLVPGGAEHATRPSRTGDRGVDGVPVRRAAVRGDRCARCRGIGGLRAHRIRAGSRSGAGAGGGRLRAEQSGPGRRAGFSRGRGDHRFGAGCRDARRRSAGARSAGARPRPGHDRWRRRVDDGGMCTVSARRHAICDQGDLHVL